MDVVILWHMHQPYYVNPVTKMALMPWVRLHSVKGYLDMIDLLECVPGVKANFNFTPVLVKQIEEFVTGEVEDLWENWSRKPAADLTEDERKRLLENFFKINWDNLIKPFPRYNELLQKRGLQWDVYKLEEALRAYTDDDYRDLQTWYNLAWCGFSAERRFPLLTELKKQGRNFTEKQKNAVLDIHRQCLALILPLYRDAEKRGVIEITTTPFFHPIQPLVYDTNLARRCMPHSPLPPRFSAPEDVRAHLRLAQEQHERVFGRKARGLWPSEGSVAPELIPLWQEAGIEYFCTDEGNLFHSLEHDPIWRGRRVDHLELFQGWRVTHEGAQVSGLFRERPLSDFIGFNAARNTAEQSAHHLIHNLENIASVDPKENSVVCIALDGENAWESFPDGAERFLTLMYEGLRDKPQLHTRRLGEYFDAHPPRVEISRLHTGSWINSDFDIWIGDPEENKGWEWLGLTRDFLVATLEKTPFPQEKIDAAWWAIYAAEGSDWFWWYGPDFTTDCDFLFDDLFRTHLKNVYRILGYESPAYLEVPICLPSQSIIYSLPHRFLYPPVTGRLENFFDWVGAGCLDLRQQQTAMFQADRVGNALRFGFNQEFFFLRLDLQAKPDTVLVQFLQPDTARIIAQAEGRDDWQTRLEKSEDKVRFTPAATRIHAAWQEFFVVAVPIADLGWKPGALVEFSVQLLENEMSRESYPERGVIQLHAPAADFEASQWFV